MVTERFHQCGSLRGELRLPGDKSISHRALIVAGLAHGTSELNNLSAGVDVRRTAVAVRTLGAAIEGLAVTGPLSPPPTDEAIGIDCGNSGTTMRLLAGVCAGLPGVAVRLVGDPSLSARPMDRIRDPLTQMGAAVDLTDGHAPITVTGRRLRGMSYEPPVASAQVKSAVLLAGLTADGSTTVTEPIPTRAHTEEILAVAGATIEVTGSSITVRPSSLAGFQIAVPADPSQAAFWAVAASLIAGSDLSLPGVYVGAARAGFLPVLQRMGARIEVDHESAATATLRIRSASLTATDVEPHEVPGLIDEVPALAVAAAAAEGVTTFRGVAELKVKESDRLRTISSMLNQLGVHCEVGSDWLAVHGGRLAGGVVNSESDHRIAMAAAVAGLVASDEVRVEGWEAVETSYPRFKEDLQACVS